MPALSLCRAIDVIIPMATLRRRRIRGAQTVISASGIRWHSRAKSQHRNQRERRQRPPGLSRHDPLALWRSDIGLHRNCACNAAKAGFNWRDLPEFRRCVSACQRSFLTHWEVIGLGHLGRSITSTRHTLQKQRRAKTQGVTTNVTKLRDGESCANECLRQSKIR
jgi:hypothetical protein